MTTNLERAAKILADGISELKVDADLNQAATIIADSIAKLQKEPNYIDYCERRRENVIKSLV